MAIVHTVHIEMSKATVKHWVTNMTRIDPEISFENFRRILNEDIDRGTYSDRRGGRVYEITRFIETDMQKLADKFGLKAVFYNQTQSHWIYIVDMNERETLAYDPLSSGGIVSIDTSNIREDDFNISSGIEKSYHDHLNLNEMTYLVYESDGIFDGISEVHDLTLKDFLIKHYFPEKPHKDEIIDYLKTLGRTQYDFHNCGPMSIYAATASEFAAEVARYPEEDMDFYVSPEISLTKDDFARLLSCLSARYDSGFNALVTFADNELGYVTTTEILKRAKELLDEEYDTLDMGVSHFSNNPFVRQYRAANQTIDAAIERALEYGDSTDLDESNINSKVFAGIFSTLAIHCSPLVGKMASLAENDEYLGAIKNAKRSLIEADLVVFSPENSIKIYKGIIALETLLNKTGLDM